MGCKADLHVTSIKVNFETNLKKAKQLFSTSNLQISFTAQTAQPKFSLPPRRGLKLVCVKHFEPYLFLRKELSKFLKYDY